MPGKARKIGPRSRPLAPAIDFRDISRGGWVGCGGGKTSPDRGSGRKMKKVSLPGKVRAHVFRNSAHVCDILTPDVSIFRPWRKSMRRERTRERERVRETRALSDIKRNKVVEKRARTAHTGRKKKRNDSRRLSTRDWRAWITRRITRISFDERRSNRVASP